MTIPFEHEFNMIISGPSKAGKTRFCMRLLDNAQTIIDPPPEKILYCYTEYQPLLFDPRSTWVQFYRGVPPLDAFEVGGPRMLVILDDMMDLIDKEVVKLFTTLSHHRNLSVIFMVQNLFLPGPNYRTISLNAHYMVIFPNPRDVSQFGHLARQMYPNDWKFAVEAYVDATSKRDGYLLLDLKPWTDPDHRLRACVLPGEQTYVYVDKHLYKPKVL